MDALNQLEIALGRFMDSANKPSLINATVLSVNRDTNTISCETANGFTLDLVSISDLVSDTIAIKKYPKVGSGVIIGFVEDSPEVSIVVSFSDIDEINIDINGTTIIISQSEVNISTSSGAIISLDSMLSLKNNSDSIANILSAMLDLLLQPLYLGNLGNPVATNPATTAIIEQVRTRITNLFK